MGQRGHSRGELPKKRIGFRLEGEQVGIAFARLARHYGMGLDAALRLTPSQAGIYLARIPSRQQDDTRQSIERGDLARSVGLTPPQEG